MIFQVPGARVAHSVFVKPLCFLLSLRPVLLLPHPAIGVSLKEDFLGWLLLTWSDLFPWLLGPGKSSCAVSFWQLIHSCVCSEDLLTVGASQLLCGSPSDSSLVPAWTVSKRICQDPAWNLSGGRAPSRVALGLGVGERGPCSWARWPVSLHPRVSMQ